LLFKILNIFILMSSIIQLLPDHVANQIAAGSSSKTSFSSSALKCSGWGWILIDYKRCWKALVQVEQWLRNECLLMHVCL
jgi:hypothetical protein